MVDEAEKHGIKIEGAPYGIEKEIEENTPDMLESGDVFPEWYNFKWKSSVRSIPCLLYSRPHRTLRNIIADNCRLLVRSIQASSFKRKLGGHYYDLARGSKRKRGVGV